MDLKTGSKLEDLGRFPRILEIPGGEANGTVIFRNKFRNLGIPREVVLTFRNSVTTGKYCSIRTNLGFRHKFLEISVRTELNGSVLPG